MIKLQDFARERGVSERAIQKHLKNNEDVLQGHFERRGKNGTWLDEYAQEYIRARMIQQPVVVLEDKTAELEQKNNELQEKLLFAYQRIDTLHEMHQARLEELNEQKLLAAKATYAIEQADREAAARADAEERARSEAARAAELEAKIAALESDVDAAKKENEALRCRSLWQRIWNKGV